MIYSLYGMLPAMQKTSSVLLYGTVYDKIACKLTIIALYKIIDYMFIN